MALSNPDMQTWDDFWHDSTDANTFGAFLLLACKLLNCACKCKVTGTNLPLKKCS